MKTLLNEMGLSPEAQNKLPKTYVAVDVIISTLKLILPDMKEGANKELLRGIIPLATEMFYKQVVQYLDSINYQFRPRSTDDARPKAGMDNLFRDMRPGLHHIGPGR